MKKTFTVCMAFTSILLAASCNNSPEKKACKLIHPIVQNSLDVPESYEPIVTETDSAFTPYDNPEWIETMIQIGNLLNEVEGLGHKLDDAEVKLEIWGSSFAKANFRKEYKQARHRYDVTKHKMDSVKNQLINLGEQAQEITNQGVRFIGYKAKHIYHAKSKNGVKIFGKRFFLFDEDFENVTMEISRAKNKIVEKAEDNMRFIEQIGEEFEEKSDKVK